MRSASVRRLESTRCFDRQVDIRFSHCDLAGIVFFPQYMVMINDGVEDFFNRGLRLGYAQVVDVRRIGLPTVHLQCDFIAPSRIGETVTHSIWLDRLGRRSFSLAHEFHVGADRRISATQVLVTTDLADHRAIELPDDIRQALQPFATAR